MLKKLILKNFQSHKHTEIDLGKLTLIVGSSDSGKTAIIRALRWLAENRPTQTSGLKNFQSTEKEPLEVTLITDSHTITRHKSESKNCYIVDNVELKAIRSSVPDEVKNALQLGEVNFQFQHDGYFLISDSPATVAQKLNKYSGVDIADKVIKKAKDFLNQKKRTLKQLQQEELEIENTIETLEEIHSKVTPLFNELEKVQKEHQKIREKLDRIEPLTEQIRDLQEVIEDLPDTQKATRMITQLENTITRLQSLCEQTAKLEKVLINITEVYEDLKLVKDVEIAERKAKQVEKYTAKLEKIHTERIHTERVVKKIKSLTIQLRDVTETIQELEEEFRDKMGNVCPLCERPL